MQERIVLAPGVKSSDLIKNLAIHGVSCINLRICGASELARMVLMRSGVAVKEEFLNSGEECALIANAVKGETYFGHPTYSDIKEIAGAIRRIRSLVVADDEQSEVERTLLKGIFTEKNSALLSVYRKYIEMLKDKGAIDGVSLVKKAIAEGKVLSESEFIVLEEYPLSPIEKALISKISGGNYKLITISDLYGLNKNQIKLENIRNCYGAPNEVETIISEIYENNTIDECVVAMTDDVTYSQLFFDYALLYDIPVTFGSGIPIINSNPARLLVSYYRWMTGAFFGKKALEEMINSKAFNKSVWYEQFPEKEENFSWKNFIETLGRLRLTNDENINKARIENYKKAIEAEEQIVRTEDEKAYKAFLQRKNCIPYLETAAQELVLPPEEFIAKYARIRKGNSTNAEKLIMKVDMSAASAIYEELGIIRRSGVEQSIDDLIMNVLKLCVCGESSEAGKLHITNIRGALCSARKNIYVTGLSATKYPGSPKENYLLLDADLKLFEGTDVAVDIYTSDGKIRRKREQLFSLAQLAADMGSKLNVSYAGLNVSELKKDNASSMLFELYRAECGKNVSSKELEKRIISVDYFKPAISVTREIGKAYNENKVVVPEGIKYPSAIDVDASSMLEKEWSPSAIQMFFDDPNTFIIQYMLGIQVPLDRPEYDVISAIDAGNLAHSLMERLANSNMEKDKFLNISSEEFDRYIAENPPVVMGNIAAAKIDFMDMMEAAYDMDEKNEVAIKEEELSCVHETGVKIHGLPDRVEKLADNSYLIVDFKTGREIKHEQDDINTCLQVVIYAYMMEKKGYKISGCEYRYLRSGETVTCRYDKEMKDELAVILAEFRDAISHFDFDGTATEE